jgi:hypothetical protein
MVFIILIIVSLFCYNEINISWHFIFLLVLFPIILDKVCAQRFLLYYEGNLFRIKSVNNKKF